MVMAGTPLTISLLCHILIDIKNNSNDGSCNDGEVNIKDALLQTEIAVAFFKTLQALSLAGDQSICIH